MGIIFSLSLSTYETGKNLQPISVGKNTSKKNANKINPENKQQEEPKEGELKIYWIRHAYSCANLKKGSGKIHTFIRDPFLSAIGIYQCMFLNDFLRNTKEGEQIVANTNTAYVSRLFRTAETAGFSLYETEIKKINILPYISETGITRDNTPRPVNTNIGLYKNFFKLRRSDIFQEKYDVCGTNTIQDYYFDSLNKTQGNRSQGNLSQRSRSQGNLSQRSRSQRSRSQGNLSQRSRSQGNLSQGSLTQGTQSHKKNVESRIKAHANKYPQISDEGYKDIRNKNRSLKILEKEDATNSKKFINHILPYLCKQTNREKNGVMIFTHTKFLKKYIGERLDKKNIIGYKTPNASIIEETVTFNKNASDNNMLNKIKSNITSYDFKYIYPYHKNQNNGNKSTNSILLKGMQNDPYFVVIPKQIRDKHICFDFIQCNANNKIKGNENNLTDDFKEQCKRIYPVIKMDKWKWEETNIKNGITYNNEYKFINTAVKDECYAKKFCENIPNKINPNKSVHNVVNLAKKQRAKNASNNTAKNASNNTAKNPPNNT